MKKLLLTLALLLTPSLASAQCNGVFANNTVCGNITGASNTPRPTNPSAFLGAAGGTSGQTQYNNAGALGGYTPSGDVTVVPSTGVETIQPGVVSNAKLANMTGPTVKGVITGTAPPSDLTPAQLTATFCNPVTSSLKGCLPALSAVPTQYLGGDGLFHKNAFIDLTAPPYSACTGSDDTTNIQAWMVAAANTGGTPAIAYVPPNAVCLFSVFAGASPFLHAPSNLTIWGYGATFKMAAASNPATTFCICDGTGGTAAGPTIINIYGLSIDGNTANRTGPFSFGNFTIVSANDINLIDTRSINCSADCYNINGNTTVGLSHRIHLDRIFAASSTGSRNGISLDGVSSAYIHQFTLFGNGLTNAAPNVAIDIEPDTLANVSNDITIDTGNIIGWVGGAICVNCAGITGGAVLVSQAMNINASGNGSTDFFQFVTPATKPGFRFINAHGVFGGSLPAVDALP